MNTQKISALKVPAIIAKLRQEIRDLKQKDKKRIAANKPFFRRIDKTFKKDLLYSLVSQVKRRSMGNKDEARKIQEIRALFDFRKNQSEEWLKEEAQKIINS